jgi:hypothetical protein
LFVLPEHHLLIKLGGAMGYFEGLADAAFKNDADGRTLFYPWGIFGRGVVVPTEQEAERLRKFQQRTYMIALPGFLAMQFVVGFWLVLLLLPPFLVWHHFKLKHMIRNFQTASDKLTMAESTRNSARSHNLSLLIAMELFSLMFVAAGFWMLWLGEAPLIALMCLWLFGLCAVVFARMIAVKVDETRTGTAQGN